MSQVQPLPTRLKERIVALDFLRGIALLGILLMNIQSFAMPSAAYFNPTAYGDLAGLNLRVWQFNHIFADSKFMTIFTILYGAGIILITRKFDERRESPARLHYRRTFWLLVIGLVHACFLWYGDILVTYAILAALVFFLRKWSPTWLIIAGGLIFSISSLLQLGVASSMDFYPDEVIADFQADWQPVSAAIAEEIAIYRSGWLRQMDHRVPASIEMQTLYFIFWGVWRVGGLMLIGMALFKLGILTAQRSSGFYWAILVAGFAAGLPLVLLGLARNFEASWDLEYSRFIGSQFNYWGSLGVSLGYIAAIMLITKSGLADWMIKPFAAVGQMALTNYLFQTVAATFIFYGYGLEWFGQVERTGQLLIVLGIWAVQLVLSPIWLQYFRFGPVEWLWRSLTYGRMQTMQVKPDGA